jgi:hypothetical protein
MTSPQPRRSLPSLPPFMLARATMILLALVIVTSSVTGAYAQTESMPASEHSHDHGGSDATSTPTAEEQAAAERLVAATRQGTSRYADAAVAEREGYRQVTPFAFYGARVAHFQRDGYVLDSQTLDPTRPEHLIYLKADDGSLSLVGVMFLAPTGQGPAIGGPLTRWHAHDDLCVNLSGLAVPALPDGACTEGTFTPAVEMLHVWLIDHPDGAFAELPPPEIVTVATPWDNTGGSLAVIASLIDFDAMYIAIGDVLHLDPADVARRVENGESWAEMAVAEGVPRDDLEQVVLDRLTSDLDRAVTDGDLLSEQRDLLVQVMPLVIGRIVDLHLGDPWIAG